MLSMEEGPYYAIKAGEDMLITHGGIRVNERFEALGGDYKPVRSLCSRCGFWRRRCGRIQCCHEWTRFRLCG